MDNSSACVESTQYKSNRKRVIFTTYNLRKGVTTALIFSFVIFMVFMPADTLGLKMASFFSLVLLNIDVILKSLLKKKYLILLYFSVLFPIFLVVLSTLMNNLDLMAALERAYVMSYLLIVPIIMKFNIDYQKIVIFVLEAMAVIISFAGVLEILGIYGLLENPIFRYLSQNNEARIGPWPASTFGYVIFFKASSLLVILVGYAIAKKKTVLLIITIMAMALTGTRANLYISLAIVCIYFIMYFKISYIKVFISMIFVFVILFNYRAIIEYIQFISLVKNSGDIARNEHFISITKVLFENPIYIIVGSGLGSYFYSTGVERYTNLVELSYLDFFRQVGLIGFIPFMLFLFKPLKTLFTNKDYIWLALTYVSYLIIAFTNPLLFSSTPFVLYILVYLKYLRLREKI